MLADVTSKFVFRRAMTLWMKEHSQEGKDGVQSYPWETKCLSAGEFSEWKVLRGGLSSDPRGHMSLDKPGLDALFRIWATGGCRVVARSASWFGADSVGQGGSHSAGHGPRFFFQAPVELPPGWFDEPVCPWVPREKPRRGPPGPKRGNNWSSLPRSARRRAMQLGQRGQLLQSRTAQASVTPTLPRRR